MSRLGGIVLLALASVAAAGCATGSVDGGMMLLDMGGSIGFATNASVAGTVDIGSGFGQGDRVGAPYGRAELTTDTGMFGAGVLASGFLYDQQGQGTVSVTFGDIPANTSVATDFSIINAKVGVYLNIDVADTVFIRPGLALDLFLPDMSVTATQIGVTETIDDIGGVPLPFVQVGADLGAVSGFFEVGYLSLDSKDLNLGGDYDVRSDTLDVEAMVRVRPTEYLELFAGYRLFALELRGRVDTDTVDFDVDLSGFMFGGGLYW